MSLEYTLALLKPLPGPKRLAAAFADLGGITGSLKDTATIGTTSLTQMPTAGHATALLGEALNQAGHPSLGDALFFTVQGSDDVDEVAEKLVALAGGAFMTEDGELRAFNPAPSAPKKPKRGSLDVSIPALVRKQFGGSQAHYCLCPRKEPTVRIQALAKAVQPEGKASYPKYAGTTTLAVGIGSVHLHAYDEVGHWEAELAALGLASPEVLFRTAFEYWHVESVPDAEWERMLALVCGLARSCDGVLYRPGGPSFDFTVAEEAQDPTPTGSNEEVAAKLISRAKTVTGHALAEALEGLARLKWVAALDALDFDDLCRRTDRAAVESVWKFLKR